MKTLEKNLNKELKNKLIKKDEQFNFFEKIIQVIPLIELILLPVLIVALPIKFISSCKNKDKVKNESFF